MAVNHAGQVQNQLLLEEHDGLLNAKRTSLVSAATIFAVVNTGAGSGNTTTVIPSGVTVFQGTTPWISLGTVTHVGLVTLAPSPSFIGIVTVTNRDMTLSGNITISDSKNFIGLTTATLGASPAFVGIVTITNRDRTITGNLTLSDAKTFIGLTTTTLGASPAFVGIVTVTNRDMTLTGNVTISDAKTYIGLTTGTLGIGDRFIGLVTAVTQNAGTTKTLIPLSLVMSTSSVVTVAVPAGGGAIFKITNLLLNSNATVRLNIKSGVTYLTGNASLGVNINPGGGWVESGSPDSPTYLGLASGAAIVLEKADSSGNIAQIGGKLIYFAE